MNLIRLQIMAKLASYFKSVNEKPKIILMNIAFKEIVFDKYVKMRDHESISIKNEIRKPRLKKLNAIEAQVKI